MSPRKWMIPIVALGLALILGSCTQVSSLLGLNEPTLSVTPTAITIGVTGSGSPAFKKITVTAKDKSGSIEGYTADSSDDSIATISNKLSSSFQINAVAAATQQTVQITVTSTSGKTAFVDVTVNPAVALTAPTGLAVSNPTSNSLDLTWTAGTGGADSYDIERASPNSTSTYAVIAPGVTGTAFTDDTNVSPSTRYYYKVRGVRSSDSSTSAWSSAANGTTSAVTTQSSPPAVPTGLAVGTPTSNTIPLSWTATPTATSYDVSQSSSQSGTYTPIATGLSSTSYTAISLASSTTYYFKVQANNTLTDGSKGSSGYSSAVAGTTIAVQQSQTAPASAPVLSIGNVYSSSIQIKWTGVSGATSYNVQRVTSTGAFLMNLAIGIISYDYTDSNALAAQTTYYYQVQAQNDNVTSGTKTGPWSSTFSATTTTAQTTLTAPTTAPTLGIGSIGVSSIQMQWGSVQNATAYDIQYGTSSAGPWTGPYTVYSQLSYTQNGLSSNTTYWFKARAWNAAGYSQYGTAVSAKTSSSASTTAPAAPTNFTLTTSNSKPYLSWGISSGASGYNIYRLDPGYSTYNYVGNTDMYTTFFTDNSTLIGGSSYSYKVVAWNQYGNSADSSIQYYYAPNSGSTISPPYVYSANSSGTSWIEIDWNYVNNATYYNVEVSTNGSTWSSVQSFDYYDYAYYYSMTGGTTYYFRVTAFDSNGNSAVSNTYTYTAPSSTTPVTVQIN